MKSSSTQDLIVGLFVLAGVAALSYLSVQIGGLDLRTKEPLALIATFDDIGGLALRAPVRIAGVKVGQVDRIELDDDLRARVFFGVEPELQLSIDSSAAIRTSGVLGDQFIAVESGAEDENLTSGEEFSYTTSALSLEKLVGQLVHSVGLDGDD